MPHITLLLALALCGAAALTLTMPSPASANLIFSDDFTRINNNMVGNNWAESGGNAADVAIANNQLAFGGAGTRSATQGNLSAVNLINIFLDYEWESAGAESVDTLVVSWSSDGTNFNS